MNKTELAKQLEVKRISELHKQERKEREAAGKAVIQFHLFCSTVINLTLRLGQMVIAKVVFDRMPISSLKGEEYEFAVALFGGSVDVPDTARRIVTLLLGRGSGKTTLIAAYAIYRAVTADLSSIGPGSVPTFVIVAPDKSTAALSIRMAREMIRSNPSLEKLVISAQDEIIELRRPDGRRVAIEAFRADARGAAVRGRDILGFVFDEAQFFRSDGAYAVNDGDIYRAIIPRLMKSGFGVFISTPWPVETLMGRLHDENFGNPKTALSGFATTSMMNPSEEMAKIIAEERIRDPENAAREFDCDTSYMKQGGFFDQESLLACVELGKHRTYPVKKNALWPTAIGVDFAFKRDSSTIAVVQYDGKEYVTSYMEEIVPEKGKPLKPSEVVARFAKIAHSYGVRSVIADGHYRESMREHLQAHNLGIVDAPEGMSGKNAVYTRAKAILDESLVTIPDNRRFIEQMKVIQARATSGGLISIRAPRRAGMGHGDLVSSWVLAVHHLATAKVGKEDNRLKLGDPGYWDWVKARREEADTKRELEAERLLAKKVMRKGRLMSL